MSGFFLSRSSCFLLSGQGEKNRPQMQFGGKNSRLGRSESRFMLSRLMVSVLAGCFKWCFFYAGSSRLSESVLGQIAILPVTVLRVTEKLFKEIQAFTAQHVGDYLYF